MERHRYVAVGPLCRLLMLWTAPPLVYRCRGVGAMKASQTTCIVGLIAFLGFYLAGGNRPVATMSDAMPEAAANAVAPALYAEASAKLAIVLRAEPGSETSEGPGPLMAAAENTDYSLFPNWRPWGIGISPSRCRQHAMRPTMPQRRVCWRRISGI